MAYVYSSLLSGDIWFTISGTVTANNMQIKAVVDSNLLIYRTIDTSAPADSLYDVNYNFAPAYTEAKGIKLASTINLSDWMKAGAAAAGSYAKSGSSSYSAATVNVDYLREYLWFRSSADSNLYLKEIEVTGAGVNFGEVNENHIGHFFNCLRIGILSTDNNGASTFQVYVPNAGTANNNATYSASNTTVKGVSKTVAGETTTYAVEAITASKVSIMSQSGTTGNYTFTYTQPSTPQYFGQIKADVGKMATMFIWFEGEDGACYTHNANLKDLQFTFTFERADIS